MFPLETFYQDFESKPQGLRPAKEEKRTLNKDKYHMLRMKKNNMACKIASVAW